MASLVGTKRKTAQEDASGPIKRSRLDDDRVSDPASQCPDDYNDNDCDNDYDYNDDDDDDDDNNSITNTNTDKHHQEDDTFSAASPAPTSRTSTQPSTPTTHPKRRVNKYVCDFPDCTKSYSRPVRLQEHQRSHTNERPFACSYHGCDKDFLRESHLKHHIKAKHQDVRDYACDWPGCDKAFHTQQRLKLHRQTHENKRPEYVCTGHPPCSQHFRKQDTLDRHIQLVHLQEKPFVCDELDRFTGHPCAARFKTSTHLIAHKDREHSGNRFWCKICSPDMADVDPRLNPDAFATAVGFPTYIEMQQHIKAIHPPTCPQCHRVCASNRDLKAHIDIQHGDIDARRNFVCEHPDCGRGFTKKGNLLVHQRTVHARQKSFICGETDITGSKRVPAWDGRGACARAFSAKANLEEHIRTQHLHLPGYVRPPKRTKKEAGDEVQPSPVAHTSQEDALLSKLTGVGYGQDRDIACIDETCPHRFIKPFDLEVHLEIVHGYTKTEAIEATVEREALAGGDFWLGGIEPDSSEQRLALQLDMALHAQDSMVDPQLFQ